MTLTLTLNCAWCAAAFSWTKRRGNTPQYCTPSCGRRARHNRQSHPCASCGALVGSRVTRCRACFSAAQRDALRTLPADRILRIVDREVAATGRTIEDIVGSAYRNLSRSRGDGLISLTLADEILSRLGEPLICVYPEAYAAEAAS